MYTLILVLFAVFITNSYEETVEETHLVTMRKEELMAIIQCVSDARNPAFCEMLGRCESQMAEQVIDAFEECVEIITQGEGRKCSINEPLFPSPEIPSKIFDCIVQKTTKLNQEEERKMKRFEACSRSLRDRIVFLRQCTVK